MAIQLYFGNQMEPLAARLSDNLKTDLLNLKNKFDPLTVIIPNQNMIKWLQLTLAGLQGILFKIRFDYLENGLWLIIGELDSNRNVFRLMDHKDRTLNIIEVLNAVDLSREVMAPLANYLLDGEGGKKIDFAPRLWQLAQRLASLFQEYEYHRPDMIKSWQVGKGSNVLMEQCQRYIYRRIYQKIPNRPTFISLFDYAQKILGTPSFSQTIKSRTIHIFGMSQIPSVYLEILNRLAVYHSIHIYSLNPSKEFWEDVQTPGEWNWLKRKESKPLAVSKAKRGNKIEETPKQHPLLAAWGKLGRENIRQLCSLTDYTFKDCYCYPENSNTILARLQTHLLTLDNVERPMLCQDKSLQIFGCPSRFREVETVYNTICYNLKQTPNLKLTDIAILVPDMNLYKPIFDAVFSRNPEMLSYNLVDSNAQKESLYGQAIVGIFELVQGNFSRKTVFELLLNPCLMRRWNIDIDEVKDWVNWADELNIFHSFSRKAHFGKKQGAKERFSWKQALQRLRLGRIMTSEDNILAVERDFCDIIPFANLAATNLETLEKFCVVIETLYQNVQTLSKFRGTRPICCRSCGFSPQDQ
jgi:exodeoxyribonuclease V gamma subunit